MHNFQWLLIYDKRNCEQKLLAYHGPKKVLCEWHLASFPASFFFRCLWIGGAAGGVKGIPISRIKLKKNCKNFIITQVISMANWDKMLIKMPYPSCLDSQVFFVAVFLQITVMITVVLKECGFCEFLMLVALAISHLLIPAALTLLYKHYLCLWLVRDI